MKKILLLILMGVTLNLSAQITTQNTLTPAQLIQDVLAGPGVVITNVKYNNSAANANVIQGNALSFTSPTFPFSSGIFMRTNGGTGTVTYDPDLGAIASNTVTNGCIIEFDFVPLGDSVSFKYMFASSEYPTYVCSGFNDAFGFFISGPGISGPYSNGGQNIALIPGTNVPVTINTVNSGTAGSAGTPSTCAAQDPNWQSNAVYFTTAYAGSAGYPYGGGTVVMTANASVQCGETYHIKLAISNVGDTGLDSGVFLEAASFSSEAVEISVATMTGDTMVIENCTDAQFIFSRPQSQIGDTLIVTYDIGGTATMGVDYNNLPNPVVFLPGEDTVILTLFPIGDGIEELPETVILTAYTITPCGDTIVTEGVLYIIDGPNLPLSFTNPTVKCYTDSVPLTATASDGFAPYTYSWTYNNQTGSTAYVPALQNGIYEYVVTATDQCGNTGTDTVIVTVDQTLAIDTMITYPASACAADGAVSGIGTGITGVPVYYWEGPNSGGPNQINASVMQNLAPGWYVFTITDNVCQVTDSVLLESEPAPIANFTPQDYFGCDPINVVIQNQSENATTFEWDFGNGNTLVESGLNSHNQVYTFNTVIRLIAINGPCRDTMETTIGVVKCGCTDPQALNYDPTAIQDDGSCLVPDPLIIVPNIFTPNGDGENDFFMITATYSTEITMQITNRWGNVVFEGTGVNPQWDGKLNGEVLPDGVYFLTYKVRGLKDQEVSGHSFLQLIR